MRARGKDGRLRSIECFYDTPFFALDGVGSCFDVALMLDLYDQPTYIDMTDARE